MKIELKNIKFSESLSEETNAFTADLWVNGKKCGYVKNDGQGGNTMVQNYSGETRELFNECETYCKTLPPHTYEFGGKTHSFPNDLEVVVDNLFEEWLEKKEEKKIQNLTKKYLVYKENGKIMTIQWKGHTIESVLKHPKGFENIKRLVKELKEKNLEIVNQNLPDEVLI